MVPSCSLTGRPILVRLTYYTCSCIRFSSSNFTLALRGTRRLCSCICCFDNEGSMVSPSRVKLCAAVKLGRKYLLVNSLLAPATYTARTWANLRRRYCRLPIRVIGMLLLRLCSLTLFVTRILPIFAFEKYYFFVLDFV